MKLDIPIYASCSPESGVFVVGGGGGQGSHGVKNKIICLRVSNSEIEQFTEYEFPSNSDSVTSLASAGENEFIAGINVPNEKNVEHLHKFALKEDKLEALKSYDLFKFKDVLEYQKASFLGKAAVVCSSEPKSQVGVVNSSDKQQTFTAGGEVIGAVQSEALVVAYENKLELRNLGDVKSVLSTYEFKSPANLCRIAQAGKDHVVVASATTLYLLKIGVKEAELVSSCATKLKAVCALSANAEFVAAASSSGEINVYSVSDSSIALASKLGVQHSLPVTSLSFDAGADVFISTSLDGSVKLHQADKPASGLKLKHIILVPLLILLLAYVTARLQDPKYLFPKHSPTPAPTSSYNHAVHTPADPTFEPSFEQTSPPPQTTDFEAVDFVTDVETPVSSNPETETEPVESDITDPALEQETEIQHENHDNPRNSHQEVDAEDPYAYVEEYAEADIEDPALEQETPEPSKPQNADVNEEIMDHSSNHESEPEPEMYGETAEEEPPFTQ